MPLSSPSYGKPGGRPDNTSNLQDLIFHAKSQAPPLASLLVTVRRWAVQLGLSSPVILIPQSRQRNDVSDETPQSGDGDEHKRMRRGLGFCMED